MSWSSWQQSIQNVLDAGVAAQGSCFVCWRGFFSSFEIILIYKQKTSLKTKMKKHKILWGLESELVITKPGDRTEAYGMPSISGSTRAGVGAGPSRVGSPRALGALGQRLCEPTSDAGRGGRAAATRASQGLRMRPGVGGLRPGPPAWGPPASAS